MLGIFDDFGSYNPYPVASGGFLLGSQVTLVLFGLHVGQVGRYYHRFGKEDKNVYRFLLVPLVFGLSCLHIALVSASLYHYFVHGIVEPTAWGSFYWGLSAQDLLIPTISFVSHIFFGHRIYVLASIKKWWWMGYLAFVVITYGTGVAFAALARIWAADPWVTYGTFKDNPVGPVANILPTVWLSCAAVIDGSLTASLLYLLLKETTVSLRSRKLITKIIGLTLETVLVTHVIGGSLFVLWLTSRTRTNAFWFFIEIIAETYSLSILFTLNSRARFRKASRPDGSLMLERQLDLMEQLERGIQRDLATAGAAHPTRTISSSAGESSSTLEAPNPMQRQRQSTAGESSQTKSVNDWDALTPTSEPEEKAFLPILSGQWPDQPTSGQEADRTARQRPRLQHAPSSSRKLSLPTPKLT